jgi:hypothetical protein
MNTPTHLACGACLAYALACTASKSPQTPGRIGLVAFGVVSVGVVSHLLLDLLPHYAWVVYLGWFKPLPFHWLIREGVFGLAVVITALILSGKSWPYVALGMFGGIYPDVEKVLAVDFHMPERFILFDWHSTYLSNRTGGFPKGALIGFECLLIAVFLLTMWRMKRTVSNHTSDVSFANRAERSR